MRSKDSFSTQIKALSYLIFPSRFIHQLVEVDYRKELLSNTGLANATDEKKGSFKSELLNGTIESAKLLRKRLAVSLVWVTSACILPIILFSFFSKSLIVSILTSSKFFAILSIVAFAWATLGRLGWEGQTFKGDTVFEQLDKNIFWLLYWLGSLLATMAFFT